VFRLSNGSSVEILDYHDIASALVEGESYELLVEVADMNSLKYYPPNSIVREKESELAEIVDLNLHLKIKSFRYIDPYLSFSPSGLSRLSFVLLNTEYGSMVTDIRYLLNLLDVSKVEVGGNLTWTNNQYHLLAIV
jgi:hypothetical protein